MGCNSDPFSVIPSWSLLFFCFQKPCLQEQLRTKGVIWR
nr:MAG TPA: hypothetical protein [Caudoviricetes sp.]